MSHSTSKRVIFPLNDPPRRRGRKRRIYLKWIEAEIRPIDPGDPRMKELLELLFPEHASKESTFADKNK